LHVDLHFMLLSESKASRGVGSVAVRRLVECSQSFIAL
jgi:hypothetical protein